MEKLPRYVEIDYSKYAPDIPEDQLETYYGLPQKVRFCKECVMSNQKPNSCYEFEHTIHSIKKTMPATPATTRPTAISTGPCGRRNCGNCAMSTARPTAPTTAWSPAPAARTVFTLPTCSSTSTACTPSP